MKFMLFYLSKHLALQVLALTVTAAAALIIFPEIDLAISSFFYDPNAGGFWLAELAILNLIRDFIKFIIGLFFLGSIAGYSVSWLLKNPLITDIRKSFEVIFLSFVLGAGVLANAMLKNQFGRARPADVEQFSGEKIFTLPFQVTNQCETNCSFVSGEGSAVTVVFLSFLLVQWVRTKGKIFRGSLNLSLFAFVSLISSTGVVLRIIKGRHFFSDSLFAILLMLLVFVCILALPRYRHLCPPFTGFVRSPR